MAATLHDPRYKVLVSALAKARRDAGLSQQALGERLDRPQSFVGKVETRERRLDALELFDYLDALGVPAGDFVADLAPHIKPRGRRRRS
ncbi:MAG: helix-turn-helix domain-containing protein [Alphaproteobacteria bacterium]|nr:helix-turn-helix domain-containing protein [Alphaproteobacteria bacterium]